MAWPPTTPEWATKLSLSPSDEELKMRFLGATSSTPDPDGIPFGNPAICVGRAATGGPGARYWPN